MIDPTGYRSRQTDGSRVAALPAPVRGRYPFRGHLLTLRSGHRLHYLDEGSGPPIVMLHGNPTWSFHYRNLVLGLRSRYRCIVPDHLGCGLSDKPEHGDYRIAGHMENLVELLDERHFKPEVRQALSHLQADEAAADDDCPLGLRHHLD